MALTLFLLGDDRIDSRHVCRGAQQARVSSISLGPQETQPSVAGPISLSLVFPGDSKSDAWPLFLSLSMSGVAVYPWLPLLLPHPLTHIFIHQHY